MAYSGSSAKSISYYYASYKAGAFTYVYVMTQISSVSICHKGAHTSPRPYIKRGVGCVQKRSGMCSREEWDVFKKGVGCVQERSGMCSKKEWDVFKRGVGCVQKRSGVCSREEWDVFKR